MLFNRSALIFTYSRTQVRIAEHERLQSLFKTFMVITLHSTISYYKMRFYTRKTELEMSTCQLDFRDPAGDGGEGRGTGTADGCRSTASWTECVDKKR